MTEQTPEEVKFRIDDWQIELIQEFNEAGEPRAFNHIYAFVKNKQNMSKLDFMETQSAIHDILAAKSVNFGILMFMQGTYVFTEAPVDLDALIIKLADGINYNGEITTLVETLDLVNTKLGRH